MRLIAEAQNWKGSKMLRALAVVLLAVAVSQGADAPVAAKEPKSAAAKNAMAKEAHAEAIANAVCRKSIVSAKRTEIADLKNAQKAALSDNNVDDATIIAAMIKELEGDIVLLEAASERVTISAKQVTIVRLDRGVYRISAEGAWMPGPAAAWKPAGPLGYGANYAAAKNLGALAFKVGTNSDALLKAVSHQPDASNETIYSENMTLTIPASCYVSMRMVDVNPDDNEGDMNVTFTRLP